MLQHEMKNVAYVTFDDPLNRDFALQDANRNPGVWIMTGSQQFHLMKNISETLAGRIAILELPPFCLNEGKGRARQLEDILWTGLFPEPAAGSLGRAQGKYGRGAL